VQETRRAFGFIPGGDVVVRLKPSRRCAELSTPGHPVLPSSQSGARAARRKPVAVRWFTLAPGGSYLSLVVRIAQDFFAGRLQMRSTASLAMLFRRAVTFSRCIILATRRTVMKAVQRCLAMLGTLNFISVATSTAHRLQTSRLELLRKAGLPAPTRSLPRLAQNNARPAIRTTNERCSHGLALIATRNFLPFAKLTAQTFLTHHPDFTVFLLLVDGKPSDAEVFSEGHVTLLPELELHNAGWYSAKFTASEFCNA
jgi:hypothetical protein